MFFIADDGSLIPARADGALFLSVVMPCQAEFVIFPLLFGVGEESFYGSYLPFLTWI